MTGYLACYAIPEGEPGTYRWDWQCYDERDEAEVSVRVAVARGGFGFVCLMVKPIWFGPDTLGRMLASPEATSDTLFLDECDDDEPEGDTDGFDNRDPSRSDVSGLPDDIPL